MGEFEVIKAKDDKKRLILVAGRLPLTQVENVAFCYEVLAYLYMPTPQQAQRMPGLEVRKVCQLRCQKANELMHQMP